MKYAATGPRKAIHRIIDTELQPHADVTGKIEITDEQVAEIEAIRAENKIPLWYDNRVTTRQVESNGFRFRWDEEAGDFEKTVIVPPVPFSISAWQAKAGLAMTPHPQAGTMLAAAEAALAAMPDGAEKIVVLSAWNNNANFERTSPTILSFGTVLGMTSDDLDNLFRFSGELTV